MLFQISAYLFICIYGSNMQADSADGKSKSDDWGLADDVHFANLHFSEQLYSLCLVVLTFK